MRDKEDVLTTFKKAKESQKEKAQNIRIIADSYLNYIKSLSHFNNKSKIFATKMNEVRLIVGKLTVSEIFEIHEELDKISTLIFF